MGRNTDLRTADGARLGAYEATPSGPSNGGIVVVQEVFGVNHHIRSVADRFVAAGYTALAPAIFDRVEKNVELAYDDDGMARGVALAKKISQEQHLASVEAAIEALAKSGPVAVVGFCLGGSLAYGAATRSRHLSASVCYYGGNIADMLGTSLLCPVMLHFGEKDAHIPLSAVDKIKVAHPDLPIYTYPEAGHGFNCDERSAYHKESADLAWSRMLAFLAQELDKDK